MGSTISVCNLSMVVLNVAFSQVGPLYYENQLQPGCCMTRDTGKVWFSVVAYVDTGNNRYDLGNAIGRHFTNTIPHAVKAASTGLTFAGLGPFAKILDVLLLGASEVIDVYKKWDNCVIHSKGWYFGSDRTLYIKGGPQVKCKSDDFRWISMSSAESYGANYYLEDAQIGYAKGVPNSCPFENYDKAIPFCNMSEPIGHNLHHYCHKHEESEVCISTNNGPDAGSNVTDIPYDSAYDVIVFADKLKVAMDQANSSHNLVYDDTDN